MFKKLFFFSFFSFSLLNAELLLLNGNCKIHTEKDKQIVISKYCNIGAEELITEFQNPVSLPIEFEPSVFAEFTGYSFDYFEPLNEKTQGILDKIPYEKKAFFIKVSDISTVYSGKGKIKAESTEVEDLLLVLEKLPLFKQVIIKGEKYLFLGVRERMYGLNKEPNHTYIRLIHFNEKYFSDRFNYIKSLDSSYVFNN